MFRTRIFLIAGITVLSLTPQLLAQGVQKPCTREEAMQAADDTDHLDNWNAVYQSFKRFSQCDDGGIAEGYSDDVGKLLADHWDQFPSLVKLATSDRAFQTFVVRHIDGCPASATGLCKLIARAAAD